MNAQFDDGRRRPQADRGAANPDGNGAAGRVTPVAAGAPRATSGGCANCGAPVKVYILDGYERGRPRRRHLCLRCAPDAVEAGVDAAPAARGVRVSTLIMLAGLLAAVLALGRDYVLPAATPGVGWRQQAALVGGVSVVLIAMLLRIDLLALSGLFVIAMAVTMDVAIGRGTPGVGAHQFLLLQVSLGFALVGYALRWRDLIRRDNGRRRRSGSAATMAEGRP